MFLQAFFRAFPGPGAGCGTRRPGREREVSPRTAAARGASPGGRRLYVTDPRRATDVSSVTDLADRDQRVRFASKMLVAKLEECPSLDAPTRFPVQANPLVGNIEGMAITGRRHGVLRLTLVADDDQSPAAITRLYGLDVRLPRR